jgi:hypothetical protein
MLKAAKSSTPVNQHSRRTSLSRIRLCVFPAGHIDYKEVCIGILKIYDSLNAKFPAHVLSPKR